MKYPLIICLIALILGQELLAQTPEKILGYARKPMPMSFYKTQIDLWKIETEKNPANEEAWMNLFRAARLLNKFDENQNGNEKQKEQVLRQIVDQMKIHIPGSYSYPYCEWVLHGNDLAYIHFLHQAIKVDSNRADHIDYLINVGELKRDQAQRNHYSLKKWDLGDVSAGMMYYNYNVLSGLDKNAILLTAGDNDTYPAWVLQAKGIRPDVTIVNVYLLRMKDYRDKLFRELQIPIIDLDEKQESTFFQSGLVQHLHENKKHFPVYLSLTASGCLTDLSPIENNLYLTGLAYRYDTSSVDNIALLRKNMEQHYNLDYLSNVFYHEISEEQVRLISLNYLVPMLKLYTHYQQCGELNRMQWIKEKLILLSKGTDQEQTIQQFVD